MIQPGSLQITAEMVLTFPIETIPVARHHQLSWGIEGHDQMGEDDTQAGLRFTNKMVLRSQNDLRASWYSIKH